MILCRSALFFLHSGGIFIFLIFASQQDIALLYLDFFRSLPSPPSTLRFSCSRHAAAVRARQTTDSSELSNSSKLRYLPRLSCQT
jgi:hypothetical protein